MRRQGENSQRPHFTQIRGPLRRQASQRRIHQRSFESVLYARSPRHAPKLQHLQPHRVRDFCLAGHIRHFRHLGTAQTDALRDRERDSSRTNFI
jgi:hypothetical protein